MASTDTPTAPDLDPNGKQLVKAFSDGELIVRGVSRIESINTPSDERIDAVFTSWQVCRVMRRDFNYICSQMFFQCKVEAKKVAIHRLLSEIHAAAFDIQTAMLRYEMPEDAPTATVQFRIISSEARLLYNALMLADRPMAKMNASEMKVVAEENFMVLGSRVSALKMTLIRDSQKTVTSRAE